MGDSSEQLPLLTPPPAIERKKKESAALQLIPERATLQNLAEAVQRCTACELYKDTTQAVFGEGGNAAEVMFVGEQPGDQEDLQGRPFVGPAGKLFDQALEEVGIDRGIVYVTNVVKHFNFEPRGKRRIHKKPNAEHIAACRPWLEAEIEQVQPEVIVCLGATAAQAILGRDFRLTQHRGEFFRSPLAPEVTATVHPSSILRAPDEDARQQAMRDFVADLEVVASALRG
jgi:uracil-DNA glycosylase